MKKRSYLSILFTLMIIDYIFTYVGVVNLNVIEEANPLLIWLFELPFISGVSIRIGYSSFICLLLNYVFVSEYKHYYKVVFSMIALNVFILFMHIYWMLVFFMQAQLT